MEANAKIETYQWVLGEDFGKVVKTNGDIISEDGDTYIMFTDGSRANTSLIGEYLMLLENPNEPLVMLNELSPQPVVRKQPQQPVQKQEKQIDKIQKQQSPIEILLKGSKKRNVAINLKLDIELPPDSLINVLKESYKNSKDEILNYIISNINDDYVKSKIKEHVQKILFTKKIKNTKKDVKPKNTLPK